jgi:hypothetical protein
LTYTPSPSGTPKPTATITLTPTIRNTVNFTEILRNTVTMRPSSTPVFINVPEILGKTTTEIEAVIGSTIEINPINDPYDSLSGGEYRDYLIGAYWFFIGYDEDGIARIFQVLDGLESSNYSIREWNQILPIFGMDVRTLPNRTAPAAVYWDNYNGFFIAVVASSSSGSPVWTVQIAQASYAP